MGQWGLAVRYALGEDWGGSCLFGGITTKPPCLLAMMIVQLIEYCIVYFFLKDSGWNLSQGLCQGAAF